MIAFRLITPSQDDAPAIAALARTAFADAFAAMNYPAEDLATHFATSMSAARYARDIADPACRMRVGLAEDGTMVGYVLIGPNVLPLPAGEPPLNETRELHQLYLLRAAHGSGLADTLMAEVFADARAHAARAVYLSVYSGNARAQRFYARHGFAELCETTFHVGNTVDDERIWKCEL